MFKGVTIIELASVLAGPSVGMFFAELGARVIKVENLRTKGDVTRHWKLPAESGVTDRSAYFSSVNWGKESIAIDLKQTKGREIVYRLLKQADIVISSYRPGQAEQLGMDAESLLAENPSLICAEINGYGAEDERAAFDAIIQAEAGFTFMNGPSPDQLCKMPVALMDILAAHQLKQAILLAWIKRLQTGKGERISVSLIESGLASLANQAANWLVAGHIPQAQGSEHPNIAPYGTIFTSKDGRRLVLAVGNDRQFEGLARLLGMAPDPRFETNRKRVENRQELNRQIQTAVQERYRDQLLQQLAEASVPAGAVNSLPEAMAMPVSNRLKLEGEGLLGLRTFVADFHENVPQLVLSPPPGLSSSADKILKIAGITDRETLDQLRQDNIVL
jgi:crotonobetainyl-CoA:carnitine CoA-transferase CaiB-like acyl-CoA transferase